MNSVNAELRKESAQMEDSSTGVEASSVLSGHLTYLNLLVELWRKVFQNKQFQETFERNCSTVTIKVIDYTSLLLSVKIHSLQCSPQSKAEWWLICFLPPNLKYTLAMFA